MAVENRHPHSSCCDPKIWNTENLSTLINDLILLLGKTVLKENIDLRDAVKGYLMLERLVCHLGLVKHRDAL